ncbi:sodium channel protein type 10 subunit alpha isoform X2 [Folsomia candida]|uniref:sodium channel protein type 10 subunit alpha isoform X2 n=1 Tax=Folsomia candida TaxID=158441 RepID=UPI001604FA74|nr:sodium channel protein type 10 subunit alpha isoform X2 [Folsomia candida]
MSQETSVIFTPLRKPCNSGRNPDAENVPFTISSRQLNLDFDLPSSITSNGAKTWLDHGQKNQLNIKDGEYLPQNERDKFDYENLACKPLEEVNPEFLRDETFLVVGRDGKVHRLSAKKSAFIFNPFNRLRRIGILISWNWQLPVLTGIALGCLCLSFILPNYASNSIATLVWNFTRYVFGGLLFSEICANVLARGILVSKFSYLRSPWEWLDIAMFIIIFLNVYWRSLFLHSLSGVLLLKFIPIVPALRTGFHVLTTQILKNLVPALIYSLLTLWILSMVGLHIKSHQMQIQNSNAADNTSFNCAHPLTPDKVIARGGSDDNQYQNESSESTRNYELHLPNSKQTPFLPRQLTEWNTNSSSILNVSFNNNCFEDYRLIGSTSRIINIFFQTTGITTFQAFGVFPNQIDPLLNHFLYVTLTLVFGTFGVSVLAAASIGFGIFDFQPHHHHLHAHQTGPVGHKFPCLPRFQLPQCDHGAFNVFKKVLFHPFMELFMTTVICLDIVFLSLTVSHTLNEYGFVSWILKNGQEAFMLLYVVETLLKLFLTPSMTTWWTFLDFLVATIFVINKFRVVKIMSRWPTLQLIFYVFFKSLYSSLSFLAILLLGLFSVRYGVATYIDGSNVLNKRVLTWLDELFLFNNWTTVFENCKTGSGIITLCFATWLFEIICGVVFASVIFVTVIYYTCDLASRPMDCCFETENYKNLEKAISLLKSQLPKCFSSCIKSNERSNSCPSPPNPTATSPRVKVIPTDLPIPTSNGGPNNNAHHIMAHHVPKIIINDDVEELGPDDSRPQQNSQVSSMMQFVRQFQSTRFFSVGVILGASAASILKFDLLQRMSPYFNPRLYIDFLFVCYFLLILLWKLVKNNFKSLKSPPWLLDFLIVSASGFTLYTSILSKVSLQDIPAVKLITSLSYFRALMLVNRLEWLKMGLVGITSVVRALWRYLFGLSVLWICLIWLKNNYETTLSSSKWFTNDDISREMTNASLGTTVATISIKTGLLFVHILLYGVFVGVVIAELLNSELLASFMTPAQCAIYKDKKLSFHREKTYHIPAPKQAGLCSQVTHYVTLTHAFDITVMVTIICDCLVITFHHLATSKDWRIIWGHYPVFIILVYMCELSMKLFGWRKYYCKSAWNLLDSVIIAVGIIDILVFKIQLGFVTAETIRFFRILRIFQLQIFTNNAKLVYICYSSLLRVLPCVGNIVFLQGILLYTFAAIGLNSGINNSTISSSNNNNMSSLGDFQGATSALNNISVSLISLPFYGSINSFQIAQTHSCWSEFVGVALPVYVYSFIILSHVLIGSFFAIVLHEILKTLSISQSLYSKHEELPHHSDDVNENKYKHTNGGFLNCDYAKSPDEPDSVSTMLTPMSDDPLDDGDEDIKYPIRMSANGYILHVEAIVTTV